MRVDTMTDDEVRAVLRDGCRPDVARCVPAGAVESTVAEVVERSLVAIRSARRAGRNPFPVPRHRVGTMLN